MRKFASVFILIVIIAFLLIAIYIYKPFPFMQTQLTASKGFTPVMISDGNTVHFYKDGLMIIGDNPAFYKWDGTEADSPFLPGDLTDGNPPGIILNSNNFIATDKGQIYNTSKIPFEKIYDNKDLKLVDLKEYNDFLVLLTRGSDKKNTPYFLLKGSDFLLSMDGLGTAFYLSSDSFFETKALSVLALDVDSPVPVTRVFNFTDINQPYGVISLDDTLIYNIIRLSSHVVLIGSSKVMCYNVNGSTEPYWQIDKVRNSAFQAVKAYDSIVLYFDDTFISKDEEQNAVFIDKNGSYKLKRLPRYMSDLQPYNNGYAGLEYDNTIILLDRQGRIISKNRLSISLKKIITTPYKPEALFGITEDNKLIMLTIKKGKD